ncbi:MAG: Txe/YoeB family addiction module toxin [Saprospiraceae bacterium]
MSYKLSILPKAESDLAWFKKNDRKSYIKSFDLLRNTLQNPREGIGKPERLKYFEEEVYSRRVNQKDRMIYTIYEEEKEIDVSSFRGHYE